MGAEPKVNDEYDNNEYSHILQSVQIHPTNN